MRRTIAALLAIIPASVLAQATNPICLGEAVFYDPGNGEDIVVPRGFKVEVFAKGLNFPTDIEFVGTARDFKAFVLESGTGLPGKCNNRVGYGGEEPTPDCPRPPSPQAGPCAKGAQATAAV